MSSAVDISLNIDSNNFNVANDSKLSIIYPPAFCCWDSGHI